MRVQIKVSTRTDEGPVSMKLDEDRADDGIYSLMWEALAHCAMSDYQKLHEVCAYFRGERTMS